MLRYPECLWPPQVTRPVLPRRNSACSQAVRVPHPKARFLGDTVPCLLRSVQILALRSLQRLLADPIPPSAAFPTSPASGCRSAAASRRSSVYLPKSVRMASIRYPNEAALFFIFLPSPADIWHSCLASLGYIPLDCFIFDDPFLPLVLVSLLVRACRLARGAWYVDGCHGASF
jgi:hypothetical protein